MPVMAAFSFPTVLPCGDSSELAQKFRQSIQNIRFLPPPMMS
jgi:hypothetical protein